MDKAYYKSPKWKELCNFVYTRDCGRCVLCNRPGVQFHHRSYDFFGLGRDSKEVNDVHLLCKRCHSRFHQIAKLAETVWTPANLIEQSNGTFIKK